jgi:spore maturation protein CgeB
MRVLCIGQEWRGSNASGLFYALARQGVVTNIINDHRYISTSASNIALKVIHKLIRPLQEQDFNDHIIAQFEAFIPDIVLVYKGAFVHQKTLLTIKKKNVPTVVFFPDVSFFAHGNNIPKCIPHYNHIFTTKSFAVKDLYEKFNFPKDKITFIPHGYDPLVHRPLKSSENDYSADVSFIGNYSKHKTHVLEAIANALPEINLKIWGGTWYQYKGEVLKKSIQGSALLGDAYVQAINGSKINLGILSEQVIGASSGDLITSRTFHIPGAGGFMIHQWSKEVEECYKENVEAAFFRDIEDLIQKISYYLIHNSERSKIAKNGTERALKDHSLDNRAKRILKVLEKLV